MELQMGLVCCSGFIAKPVFHSSSSRRPLLRVCMCSGAADDERALGPPVDEEQPV